MTSSEGKEEKKSFRKSLSSMLTPPAKKRHDKVLAASYRASSAGSDGDGELQKGETALTDEEKAKRLVAERDASCPTGNFMLGVYRPLSTSQGYEDYYTAKGATGS